VLQGWLNGAGRCVRVGRFGDGQVLRDGFLVLYCAAVGFVASGVAASFFKMVTHEPPRFALLGKGWFATAVTFLFCAVTGPAIVMDLVIRNRNMKSGAVGYVAAGLFVAVLWSICSGLLVLDLVLQLKETLA
jgi:cytochrome c biogenesis protein CcdA